MKKLTTLMAAGLALVAYNSASAQVGLHLNLNLGGVAVHAAYNTAPVQYSAYDNDDDYYYLPDVEAYYNVPQHSYYYNDGERWVSAAYLPGAYRNFDWRNARHYEIIGKRPFMHHDMYRTRYGGFDQRGPAFSGNHYSQMGGQRQDNRFDSRGGYDQRGGFDNRGNDNRGGQFQGGFDRQDRMNRGGQYQNGNDQNQNRGGQYRGGNQGQPQMGGSMPQNGNGQNRGGDSRGGNQGQNSAQPQNGGGFQNRGQNRGGQPANDGQNRHSGDFQNGNNHFAANKMGMMRPSRF